MEKLSNNVLEKVEGLVDFIKSSPDYRRYIELKNKIKENKSIMALINDIKRYQKDIVNKQYNNQDISDLEIKIANSLKELNTFPIYLEYSYLQDDLNYLFQSIKTTLENYINKLIQ